MPHRPRKRSTRELPRINLRILIFCALGLLFGIFLCFRLMFGGLRPSDFLFIAAFFVCALFPLEKKRLLAMALAFVLFGGAGALVANAYANSYLSGPAEGDYTVEGTVVSFTPAVGVTHVLLGDLTVDGKRVGGKLSVSLESEAVRPGDVVSFEAELLRGELPNSEAEYYYFYTDIRYFAPDQSFNKVGTSKNIFLRLNAALYDCLEEGMGGTEADVAYALLTGSSKGMDEGLTEEVRRGGIAHIFAVSGLHIGILFGAAMLVFRPLKKYAFLPSSVLAFLYCAFCGFSVSSLRAAIMCLVMAFFRAFGKKYDFLNSISLAAVIVLLIFPADFLSPGFRLSFGACVGLALYSGSLSRLFAKIPKFPRFLSSYFSANLSVQLFTLPILLETFGYFSWWGFVLNLFLIPCLPVLFLAVLLCSVIALCIPPAAAFFLILPKGLLSLFLFVLSWGEFTAVLTGFSLGAGGIVWLTGSVLLSERFRLKLLPRTVLAGCLSLLIALCCLFENVVFSGGKAVAYDAHTGSAVLIQTPSSHVLVIDGTITAEDCNEFLAHRYQGTLDAVFVASGKETDGINHAIFLDTHVIYAKDEVETGLQHSPVVFTEQAEAGGLTFTFLTREKLTVEGEGVLIEIDFLGKEALGSDFFVHSGCGDLIFFFRDGIIKEI